MRKNNNLRVKIYHLFNHKIYTHKKHDEVRLTNYCNYTNRLYYVIVAETRENYTGVIALCF